MRLKELAKKTKTKLVEKKAEGYIDTAVIMIISVVIGALLLAGLYYLFNSVVLPGLAERIQDMFGSTGGSGGGGSGGFIISL